MADNGAYGYHVGETINGTTSGFYNILSSSGTIIQAAGTLYDISYFRFDKSKTYTPVYDFSASYGYNSGTNGLNQDLTTSSTGAQYHPFGDGGTYEANIALAVGSAGTINSNSHAADQGIDLRDISFAAQTTLAFRPMNPTPAVRW